MTGICANCKIKYARLAAGQAFTYYKCALCGKRDLWANTSTPSLCYDCAEKKHLCIRCGGKLC